MKQNDFAKLGAGLGSYAKWSATNKPKAKKRKVKPVKKNIKR